MKNLTKIGLLVLMIVITLMSCKKEVKKAPKVIDGLALKEYISSKREAKTQSFIVDMSSILGDEIVGEQGTIIKFSNGQIKDKLGNVVTGNIDIKLLEIYSKADMMLMNKTTMGKLPDGNHAMLVSGGEMLLTASQNGEELEINGQLNVLFPVDNTGGADENMKIFKNPCCIDEDCGDAIICEEDVWEIEEDSLVNNIFIEDISNITYYNTFISNFGWTNVDRFYSFTGPKTELLVLAPEGYDDTNCAIYLSYDGEESGLASLDSYNATSGLFSEHYGQIPVGLDVHIIAVSIVDEEYSYTIKSATIVDGGTIILEELLPITESALVTEVENLP